MLRIVRSRVFVALGAVIVTAVVVGGTAWALQSPVDGTGTIHGCYNPASGAVKLNVQTSCPATGDAMPITWNAQGPQGPEGDQGPQGAAGPAGAAAPAAQVRNIFLGQSPSIPTNGGFDFPEIDVHDCQQLAVTTVVAGVGNLQSVTIEMSQGGGSVLYTDDTQTTPTGGGSSPGYWKFPNYSPYPTAVIRLKGSATVSLPPVSVWVQCVTFHD